MLKFKAEILTRVLAMNEEGGTTFMHCTWLIALAAKSSNKLSKGVVGYYQYSNLVEPVNLTQFITVFDSNMENYYKVYRALK